MDKQQWDLEFDKAMDDKFVTQQLIMEITDQIEELEKALIEMVTYGNQDIEATRDLYNRFQGWMKGVPNLGVITNEVTENKTLRCIHLW